MHKQVSGWTVNFGPNFPESPFLELKSRKSPPLPFQKTSDLGWPKFTLEYPPGPHYFGKLQIWDDQSLLWNTPHPPTPHFGKLQIWDDQSLLRNTPNPPPPHFGKLQIWDDQSLLWNTPSPPFWKISDLGWPKFTPEYPHPPPPQWKLSESPSPRFSEYRELLHVETLSNPDNYYFLPCRGCWT